jgi:type I restriction enzyme M protein
VFRANHESATTLLPSSASCATNRATSCSEPRGKQKGKPQADSKLRDTENVPLSEDVQTYFQCEVLPRSLDRRVQA